MLVMSNTSNFVENFGSGMGFFGSIRVSGPLSGEHISGVESGMGPGHSVRVSDLGSVLPDLLIDTIPILVLCGNSYPEVDT